MIRSALLVIGLAALQGGERRAAELAEKLRSDRIQEREAAARELKTLGKSAETALAPLLKDSDPEVASQARHLLRSLQLRTHVPSGLFDRWPGLEDRLLAGDDGPWQDLFFEATAAESEISRSLRPDDLRFIVERALAAAQTEDAKFQICLRVASTKCVPAAACMVRLIGDENGNVREFAEDALREVGSPELVPELAKHLQNRKPGIRRAAARMLSRFGGKESVAVFIQALGDSSSGVQQEALQSLINLDAREARDPILALRDSADPRIRALAADALIAFRAPEGAVRMLELLSHPSEIARAEAAYRLGLRRIRDSIPTLRLLLDDRSGAVRGCSAAALGRLGDVDSTPTFIKLLDDADYSARQGAAAALGYLDRPKAIDSLIRALDDPEGGVRARAAQSLCRLGSSRGVRTLLNEAQSVGYSFLSLTAIADPPLWKRLSKETLAEDLRGTPEEILKRLCSEAGLNLELPESFSENRMTRYSQRIVTLDSTLTWVQALEELGPPGPYDVILKDGTLRVLNHGHAGEFWATWYATTSPDPK